MIQPPHHYPQQYPGHSPPPGHPQSWRPPAAPFPPPVLDPVVAKRQKRQQIIIGLVLTALLFIPGVAYGVMRLSQAEPGLGDCLASTDKGLFSGVEIVDCDSAEARWVVVAHSERSENPCLGRDRGEEIVDMVGDGTRTGERLNWAVCVKPT